MLAWSPRYVLSFPDCASLADLGVLFRILVISSNFRSIKCGVEFWLSNKADLKVSCLAFWWGWLLLGSVFLALGEKRWLHM